MPASTTPVQVGRHRVQLSNLDKVFYPETGFTKGQVLEYYTRIAPVMLPHLRHRPLNLKRYPNGVHKPFFFQKECPANRPSWLKTATTWSETKGDDINYCTASDLASLAWIANTGCLEMHTLLARAPHFERPTVMVFDLDPGAGAGLPECADVGLLVRQELADIGLASFPKTSGSKGIQVYVPVNGATSYDVTSRLAHHIARNLEQEHPEAVVSNMRKALRQGKVLIDWSQNARHKSTVCAYSLRATPTPSVSMPVSWQELSTLAKRGHPERLRFTPEQALARVAKKGDLFEQVATMRQRLPSLGA